MTHWFERLSPPREISMGLFALVWGEPSDKPPLVLIHGGAAHAHWWDPIAPWLAHDRQVLALDLSGHGDSPRHPAYPRQLWGEELVRAVGAMRPILIGHSTGGRACLEAAVARPELFTGLVLVDSPVHGPNFRGPEWVPSPRRELPVYPDLSAAVERFRLLPPQPEPAERILLEHVARHSVRVLEDGRATWKFDPNIIGDMPDQRARDSLAALTVPLALIRGEHSTVLPPETWDYMRSVQPGPAIEIPAAHHHLLLDQPLALVAALRTLLQLWP
jgi:pimeloyl-ACP methyl ester carboxylesterase